MHQFSEIDRGGPHSLGEVSIDLGTQQQDNGKVVEECKGYSTSVEEIIVLFI